MKIAYDVVLLRPGCALVQAAMGGFTNVSWLFPTDTWLTSNTPDMSVYEVTSDQLEKLVKMTEENCVKVS